MLLAALLATLALPPRKDRPMFRRLLDRLTRTASDERSPDWCHRHNCHRSACPTPDH
jgi:hypothetical protein